MSNISLELNFELYQHLVDIYNIPQDDYAAEYVFNASYNIADVSSGYGGYASVNGLSEPLSEKAVMSILFSKFYTDKTKSIDNTTYINYILKESYSSYIEYSNDIPVLYYEDNMQITNSEKPYINPKIIDFDISSYAAYNVRYYLLYLDIISQIYKYAYERKKNKEIIISDNINIQSRYSIQNAQLQRCEVFNITLKPQIEGIDNRITNIAYTADKNISNAFTIFKADIMRHLKYLTGEDVRLTGLSYLKTIEYFYKFCRLRLMYLVSHSIRLLSDTTGQISSKFNNFILEEVLAVFTNFREKINNEIIQSQNLKMTKNMLYNKSVLDTSTKLQDINDQIAANRNNILNNQSLLAQIDNEYSNTYRVHLTATVVLFMSVLAAIILAVIQIGAYMKANISLGITVLLVVFIIVLYVVSNVSVLEKFENALSLEEQDIKFPRATLIGIKTIYADGTVVNVKSSNDTCAYALFNNERSRPGLVTCNSGWSHSGTYKWVSIDLGEYIVLRSLKITINAADKTTRAPKNITLYGSKFLSAFKNSDQNTNWDVIKTIDVLFNSPSFGGIIEEQVNIDAATVAYPYYKLSINSVMDGGNTVKMRYVDIYGVRNYKTSPEISNIISSVSVGGGVQQFTAKPLPIDYNDQKLLSWDLTLTANNKSSECVLMSMGTFCFNNTNRIEFLNQTSALDPYGAQYVTGIVEAKNTALTDVKYSLVVRYHPTVIDAEQVATATDFTNLDSSVNEIRNQRDRAYTALELTSNILRSSNIKISDYLKGISSMTTTCNMYKTNLADYGRYTILKSDYDTSNDMLRDFLSTSNAYVQDLLTAQRNLSDVNNEYTISNNLNIELTNTFNNLKGNVMTSINYFRSYMDASEIALANQIEAQISIGNVDKVKLSTLQDVGKDKIDELTASILINEAKNRREEAVNKAEISAKHSSTSFLNSEAYELELENTRMQVAIDGSKSILENLSNTIGQEIAKKNAAESQMGEATSAREEAQATGSAKLNEMNIKYNTNYASLDELNTALTEKLKTEKSLKAAALQEYDDLQYEEKVAQHKLNNANTMISFYDALSAQTNATISIYDGYISNFEGQLQDLHKEKLDLEDKLDAQKREASERVNAALTSYREIDNRTFQEILMLKVQHSTLLRDIAKRRSEEAAKYQEFLAKRKEKETATEKLDAIVKQKEAEMSKRDYYKSVRDAIKDDVDISMVIKDIDVSIVYSITDNINSINYDLITPNMSSEYYQFDKYRKSMQLSVHQSEFDLNNKILNIRAMEARTMLFFNLSLIIMISITFHYYLSSQVAAVVAIVATIIAIVVYSVKLRGPVRSRARNYYWN